MSSDNQILLDNDEELPLVYESEKQIDKDAKQAVKFLQRTDNLDLAEVLGLSSYSRRFMTEESNKAQETLSEPRVTAAIDLLHRLGASSVEFRYSEPDEGDDENSPTVWMTIAAFERYDAPHQVAAALNPLVSTERLLEQLVDGGTCQHCLRPTVYFSDPAEEFGPPNLCAYTYDPELEKYRRSCEGDN